MKLLGHSWRYWCQIVIMLPPICVASVLERLYDLYLLRFRYDRNGKRK